MPGGRVVEIKATLDRLVAESKLYEPPAPEALEILAEARHNFLTAGPELVDQATPYLWEYYRFVADEYDAAERAEYGIPELTPDMDIWEPVEMEVDGFEFRVGGRRYSPGKSYFAFGGSVTWEEEHGLGLVFEHGLRVCKVGPCDGHITNAHAYADLSLLDVIFH